METQQITAHRRVYSDREQADAIAIIIAHAGSTRLASIETGIPETTLRQWRDQTRRVHRDPALVSEAKANLADDWEEVAAEGVRVAVSKLPEASAAQAAVIAGIATEKMLLLRGEATNITQHQDDARLSALEAQYGALRAVIPITDAATTPEPPSTSHPMPIEAVPLPASGQPPY